MRMNHRHLRGLVRQLHNQVRIQRREGVPPPYGPFPGNRRRPGARRPDVPPQDPPRAPPLAQPLPRTPRREIPLEPVPAREIADGPRRLDFDELDP